MEIFFFFKNTQDSVYRQCYYQVKIICHADNLQQQWTLLFNQAPPDCQTKLNPSNTQIYLFSKSQNTHKTKNYSYSDTDTEQKKAMSYLNYKVLTYFNGDTCSYHIFFIWKMLFANLCHAPFSHLSKLTCCADN